MGVLIAVAEFARDLLIVRTYPGIVHRCRSNGGGKPVGVDGYPAGRSHAAFGGERIRHSARTRLRHKAGIHQANKANGITGLTACGK